MLKNNFISAIVITYNEEENIKDCLKSLEWVDEIILVDSYSRDKTVNIAAQYTKKIYYKRFNNDFSVQRNFALQQVSPSSKWILTLDADETLLKTSHKIIDTLTQSTEIEGFWFPRRNYIKPNTYLRYGLFYPDYQLRLFRNKSNIKYKGVIHEEPVIHKNRTRQVDEIEIYHNCTRTKYDKFASLVKFIPYIQIEAKYMAKSRESLACLFITCILNTCEYFFSSYIRGKGYKDGYIGFRAALLFGVYRSLVSFYAMKYRYCNLIT